MRVKQGLNKATNFMVKQVKNNDIYGVPVSLNFKGEDSFKTFIGGITTFVVAGCILYYAIIQSLLVVRKGKFHRGLQCQSYLSYCCFRKLLGKFK